jgi:hypothetical protein
LFADEKVKLIICLSYYYGLTVFEDDINLYDECSKEHKIQNILNLNAAESKADRFKNLCQMVNIVENKNLKQDAVRIWLNKAIDRIIYRLNGPFERAYYDKKSFQLLFEFYHQNRNESVINNQK